MSTVKSYVKQVLAQLTGDQNAVVAERNYRTAKASVKGQVAALEARLVKEETAVEKANEDLFKAKYPTTEISDGEYYLENIVSAQETADYAQAKLDSTNKSIEFFKNLSEEFEVEATA